MMIILRAGMLPYFFRFIIAFLLFFWFDSIAQVNYGSTATYGLRKTVPSYTGSAVQVRRLCDNVVRDIGFTSCGEIDTIVLRQFVVGSNPLSAVTTSAAAAYSLRKLRCGYNGNAITVRRSCDNATADIGFTSYGDLDTTALKTFVLASNPLTALSASSAAAFSLRKLRCAYAGSAIQVRRSSDNATQDIGFTASGNLDTTALKTFVGASGNGFIRTWYDQSGNANHAIQTNNTNQPQLVVAGKVNRQNNQPSIIFNTTLTSFLNITYAASLNFSSASTTNAVFAKTAAPVGVPAIFTQSFAPNNISVAMGWNNGTNTSGPMSIGHYPGTSWSILALTTDVTTNANTIMTGSIRSGASNTSTMTLYQNGNLEGSANNKLTIGTNATQPFIIGKRWDFAEYAPANIQEIIVFSSALSNTDRQYLEWGQSQYYNISGPTLTSVPAGAPSAFVTTWYDQSLNARHATQATAGNQPRIVNAGVVERDNGVPSLRFLGITSGLATANFDAYDNAACFNGVVRIVNNLTYNAFVSKTGAPSNNNFPSPLDFYNSTVVVGQGTAATFFTTSQGLNSSQPLSAWTLQSQLSGNKTVFLNGTSVLNSATAASHADVNRPLNIGMRNDGLTSLDGYISEIVTFDALPSATDRAYLEWTQGVYYNIPAIVPGTMPAGAPSAYVTTWYDQSGNGNHISQATASRQPIIINNGLFVKMGGKMAVQGVNASQTNLTTTLTAYSGASLSVNSVLMADAGSTANVRVVSVGNTALSSGDYNNANYFNINQRSTNQFVIERNSGINPTTTFTVASPMILSASFNGTNRQLFNNGTGSATTADAASFNFTSVRLLQSINPAFEAGEAFSGRMAEFGMYYSALSTTRRTLLETNQSAYYRMTISNNKYTSPTASSYHLFVNGIGREAASDTVRGTRNTSGMGLSVTTATTSFLKDNGDYITFGMDCPATAKESTTFLTGSVIRRWTNDWYLNKTDVSNNAGSVTVFFDFSDYGLTISPGVPANYMLLYRNSTASNFSVVPTTSVSVSGDRVLFSVEAASLTTNYYYTIGTTNPTVSPLPLELVNFSCNTTEARNTELKWTTASESNTNYFLLEKSSDGLSFSSIAKINAAGNSVSKINYAYTDQTVWDGISYYRLKCVDKDETFSYSPLCYSTDSKIKNDLILKPNPSNGSVFVDFANTAYQQPDSYIVMDVAGKIAEARTTWNGDVLVLDLSHLQSGIYFLEVYKGNQKTVKRIALQR